MSAIAQQPSKSPSSLKSARNVSNMLALWALCEERTCRKAGACRALRLTCLRECVDLVPTDAGAFVLALFDWEKEKPSFDDALARVPQDLREEWCAWHQAVTRMTGRPSLAPLAKRAGRPAP